MRTTLEIPDPLFREVKARAAQSGLKLKELLTRYIEAGLKAPDVQSVKPRTKRAPLPILFEKTPSAPSTPALTNSELFAILDQEDLEQLKRAWGMTDEAR
jgi:hypothetical protein